MVFFVPLSRIIAIVGIVFAAIGVVLNLIALDIPRIIGGIISVAIRYIFCCDVKDGLVTKKLFFF